MAAPPSRPRQQLGNEFMAMIGNCITEWANVDEALFAICWRCLGCTKEKAAIVYYRSPTIDARMTLIDELVKSSLPKTDPPSRTHVHDHADVKRWDSIEGQFRRLQGTRRRIAHQPVIMTLGSFRDDYNNPAISDPSFAIYMSQSEAARGRSADLNTRPLTINDLHLHLQKLNLITEELYQMLRNVLPRHMPAFPWPPPEPIRIRIPIPRSPIKPPRRRKSSPP
jgi:hypothetical protein